MLHRPLTKCFCKAAIFPNYDNCVYIIYSISYVIIISPPFMTIIVFIFVITLSNIFHVNKICVLSTIIANACSKLKKYYIFHLFVVMSQN